MHIFITGGTEGIGWALAQAWLEQGHTVGVAGRHPQKIGAQLRDGYSGLEVYQLDVTDREAVQNCVASFAAENGLDLLLANAGISVGAKKGGPDFDRAHTLMAINVMGVLNAFEAALTIMRRQGHGHIAATTSVAGFVGLPGAGPYCASKAAVLKLCESYSLDLAAENIAVSAIAPGFVDTALTRQNDHKMPFMMEPSQAAAKIIKGLARRKPLIIFPWPMRVVITFLDKLPRRWYRGLMRCAGQCRRR